MASVEAHPLLTAVAIAVCAVGAFYAVDAAYDWSDDRIAANERDLLTAPPIWYPPFSAFAS